MLFKIIEVSLIKPKTMFDKNNYFRGLNAHLLYTLYRNMRIYYLCYVVYFTLGNMSASLAAEQTQ